MSSTVLQTNDNLLVATKRDEVSAMEILFGQMVNRDLNKEQVDWNHLDTKVESRVIILSNGVLNGKKLGQLHLRDAYNVNVSRVIRADIKLLATQDLVLPLWRPPYLSGSTRGYRPCREVPWQFS